MNFLNPLLLSSTYYIFLIDLLILILGLLSSIFLFLDIILSEDKYKDSFYDLMFFIFMFCFGYIIGRFL